MTIMRILDLACVPSHVGLDLGQTDPIRLARNTIVEFDALVRRNAPESTSSAFPAPVPPHLLLSMIPKLLAQLVRYENRGHGLNYGLEDVRFEGLLNSDEEFWLRAHLAEARPRGGGLLISHDLVIENAKDRICSARALVLIFPAQPVHHAAATQVARKPSECL